MKPETNSDQIIRQVLSGFPYASGAAAPATRCAACGTLSPTCIIDLGLPGTWTASRPCSGSRRNRLWHPDP